MGVSYTGERMIGNLPFSLLKGQKEREKREKERDRDQGKKKNMKFS